MNENYNVEDDGVSMGEIFSWIWLKKIWFLVITLVVTLVISLVFILGINPLRAEYNVTFSYQGVKNLDNGTYIDGTKFDYHNIISKNSIVEVVNSNDHFKTINVDKLVRDNDFTIDKTVVREKESDLASEIVAVVYSVDVPSKYFDNPKQASEFFLQLIYEPVKYNETALNLYRFDQNLVNAKNSKTFETELALMQTQVDYIKKIYESMLLEFGDIIIYSEDKTESNRLTTLLANFNHTIETLNFNSLKNDLAVNLYVKDVEYTNISIENDIKLIDKKIKLIRSKINNLNLQLDALMKQTANLGVSQAISEIVSEISRLESEETSLYEDKQDLISRKSNYDKVKSEAFDKKLDLVLAELVEETNILTSTYKYANTNSQSVQFKHANIVKSSGTFNIIIIGGLSLVLGLCSGALVSGILGHNEAKKKLTRKEEE